jgi:uncharacterized protein involved in exopolysaccharide biosynthesis
MQHSSPSVVGPLDVVKILAAHRARWILPAGIMTAASLGYALLRSPVWEASQPLVVRDEAAGSESRPGKFENADDMKTAQETVLELATSRRVIAAALKAIGPPASRRSPEQWPTKQDVEEAQGAVRIVAPNGAEFGRTEVFYVKVNNGDAQRAALLTEAVCDEVDSRMRELRDRKAQSLVDELTTAAQLARADLQRSTAELSEVERQVGGDLAELRILSQSDFGESNLRQTLIQLKNEQRQARTAQRTAEQLLEMLRAAQKDPNQLVATPNELLAAQPALSQLKTGLVEAELSAARLLGEMSEAHPRVKAAMASQENIRRRLHAELDAAVRGLEAELKLSADRVASIEEQLVEATSRMDKVAALRAPYHNLVCEVAQRSKTLEQAEQELGAARASRAAALSTSLITRLDHPTTGNRPLGPSKALITLAGLAGGLIAGLGLVFLTVPLTGADTTTAGQGGWSFARRSSTAVRNRSAAYHGLSLKQALWRLAESTPSRN